jgi:hypothetical protein
MKCKCNIYVSNANGGLEGCPDFKSVFFGSLEGYVHPAKAEMKPVGHVTVMGHSKAVALRDQLNTTGDWQCEDGVRPGSPITIPDWEEKVMGYYREAPNTQK